MKKRILLIIMILFSIKVNSNDDCKLPSIKFFEMLEEDGDTKFSFKPFVEKISREGEKLSIKKIKILGIEFDRELALGALVQIGEFFESAFLKKILSGAEANLKDIQELSAILMTRTAELDAYMAAVNAEDLHRLEDAIAGNTDTQIQGMADYLLTVVEKSKIPWFGWLLGTTKYLESEHAQLLNAGLSYAYLWALSFLITDPQTKSKFLACMQDILDSTLNEKLEAVQDFAVKFGMLNIFDDITLSMAGKIKPTPLTLEQNREVLNLLSSSLTSLAHLKFD